MTFVLAQWLVTIFAVISLIHVYWALGGQWAAVAAVPQVPEEGGARSRPAFKPTGWLTLLVAFGLLLIAALLRWCVCALAGGCRRCPINRCNG